MEHMASKKDQNPLEAEPERAEKAGVMQLNSWKKKLKVNILFGNRSLSCKERSRKREPDNKSDKLNC